MGKTRAVKIEHRDKPCYLFDACKKRYIVYTRTRARNKLPRDLLFPFELSLVSVILRTIRAVSPAPSSFLRKKIFLQVLYKLSRSLSCAVKLSHGEFEVARNRHVSPPAPSLSLSLSLKKKITLSKSVSCEKIFKFTFYFIPRGRYVKYFTQMKRRR